MKALLTVIALATFLAGCSALTGSEAFVTEAVQQKMEFNDNKARLLKIAVCDISVGAYHRALSQDERDAVTTLCGGQRTVTAEDVVTLRALVDALRAAPGN
jgi:PBP1b-binding outer membrane lipoprotein LpoB